MLLQGFACDQSQTSLSPFAPLARMPPTSAAAAALAFASPPASPPQMSAPNTLGNLFNTCRSLQALLAAPALAPAPSALLPITPPQQHHELLATPPLAHAPSPMKLRLRSRRAGASGGGDNNSSSPAANTAVGAAAMTAGAAVARKRIVKCAQPPRGLNKRRRAADDDMGRDDDIDADVVDADEAEVSDFADAEDYHHHTNASEPFSISLLAPSPLRRYPGSASTSASPFGTRTRAATMSSLLPPFDHTSEALPPTATTMPTTTTPTAAATTSTPPRPQTPKRARIAPEALPLGLERGDFHALHADGIPDDSSRGRTAAAAGTDVEVEADGATWSTEEDRMLVELVLEKLKLSKTEWQDCARSLGKDRHSLGRRWKSLMLHGDIGLKPGSRSSRRGKIHGTWR